MGSTIGLPIHSEERKGGCGLVGESRVGECGSILVFKLGDL